MAEAAPRNHRHVGSAGGEHRRQHQADVVADSAGGMLVDDRAGQIGPAPVERFARTRHGAREMHALVDVHAAKENRHGERRDLPVADRARCQAGDELPDLLARQRAAVALGADDLLRQHQQIRFSNICDLSVYFSVLNQRRQPWFPRSAMRVTPTYDGSPLVLSRMRRLDEHALGVFVRSRQGGIGGLLTARSAQSMDSAFEWTANPASAPSDASAKIMHAHCVSVEIPSRCRS